MSEYELWVLPDSTEEEERAEELAESMLHQHFPEIYKVKVRCPACVEEESPSSWGSGYGSMFGVTIHLNDQHKWGREKVASWLELISREHGVDLTYKTPEELPSTNRWKGPRG